MFAIGSCFSALMSLTRPLATLAVACAAVWLALSLPAAAQTAPTSITLTVDADNLLTGVQEQVLEGLNRTMHVTATVDGTQGFSEDKTLTVTVGHDGDTAGKGVELSCFGDSNIDYKQPVSEQLTITITAGDLSGSTQIGLIQTRMQRVRTCGNDNQYEGSEFLTIRATVDGDTAVTVSEAKVTIIDEEFPPTVTLKLSKDSIREINRRGVVRESIVTATLVGALSSVKTTVTVSAEADWPAVAGDFTLSENRTLSIRGGDRNSTGTVKITTVDNDVDAPDKTVTVKGIASNTLGLAGGPADKTLTIRDDDTDITLTVDTDEVSEGGAASTTVRVTAMIEGTDRFDKARVIDVSVGHDGDTATGGPDYANVPDFTITIPANQASGSNTFSLTPTDDTTHEGDERVSVRGEMRSTVSGVGVDPSVRVGETTFTIADDDSEPTVTLRLSESEISENGGTATVTAGLGHASGVATTVTVSAVAGPSAVAGDFTMSANRTLTIPAGALNSTGIGVAAGGLALGGLFAIFELLDWEDGPDDPAQADPADPRPRPEGSTSVTRTRDGRTRTWVRTWSGVQSRLAAGTRLQLHGAGTGTATHLGHGLHLSFAALPAVHLTDAGTPAALTGGLLLAGGEWRGQHLFAKLRLAHGRYWAADQFTPARLGRQTSRRGLTQQHVEAVGGTQTIWAGWQAQAQAALFEVLQIGSLRFFAPAVGAVYFAFVVDAV